MGLSDVPDPSPRGGPSTAVVDGDGDDCLTIGVDVGGTSIRAAVIDRSGRVLDTVRTQTPKRASALNQAIVSAVKDLGARHPCHAVGLAVAGFITPDRQTVRFAPHLPWRNARVPQHISNQLGIPVIMEHDANAAAWAEFVYGPAARGNVTLVIAIGTGVGAGLIIDGDLYRGSFGVAPELGHLQVVPDGRQCPCGKAGCFERYCSGTALVDTVIELLAQRDNWGSVLAREAANNPGSLTGRRVAAAAQDGDPVALAAFDDFAQWLGLGLAFASDIFDPDLIVLAGGVGASSDLYLNRAREHYAAKITGSGHRQLARLRSTQLGEAAAMIGAAALATKADGVASGRSVQK